MIKGFTFATLFSVFCLFPSGAPLAATYTVDPAGDDANPGTPEAPFATIQHAIGLAGPGDEIIARDGHYAEDIRVDQSGDPDAPLLIRAENARAARIDGLTIAADDVVLDGFAIHDNQGTAIYSDRSRTPRPTRVTIRNFHVFQPAMGIQINGHEWLVENNEIERLVRWKDEGDNDYARVFGTGHVIRNNSFHGTPRGSVGPAHVDGLQTFTTSYKGRDGVSDLLVERNVFMDMHQGIILEGTAEMGNANIIIRDNIFANAWSWGVLVKNFTENVVLDHNVFYNVRYHGSGVGEAGEMTVTNNIFFSTGSSYFTRDGGKVEGDYNLIFSSKPPSVRGPHNIYRGPVMFKDPDSGDFSLLPGSPAIGGAEDGSNLGPRFRPGVIR